MASADEAADELTTVTAPPWRRPPILRRRFWRRYGLMRALLLVLILLIPDLQPIMQRQAERASLLRVRSAAAATIHPNTALVQPARHQAVAPSPSGAYPPYPLNHTIDAESVAVGTPPTNFDFETAGSDVGAPPPNSDFAASPTIAAAPANADFETGDFTSWSVTGAPAIGSDVSHGFYAELNASGQALVSAAISVPSDAQTLSFDLACGGSSGALYLDALSGTGYATSTNLGFFSCSGAGVWSTIALDPSAYRGQSIKLQFRAFFGYVARVDNVAFTIPAPNYVSTGVIGRASDGGNPYATLAWGATLTSTAFSVDASAQSGSARLTGLAGSPSQATIVVLSGGSYATSTTVATVTGLVAGTWTTARFSLAAWSGQSIKLKVAAAYRDVGVDDLGIQRVDFPDWTVSDLASVVAGSPGGHAAYGGAIFTSSAFTLPAAVQELSVRYRVSDGGGTGVAVELLRGPSFATAVNLSSGYLSGTIGQWQTFKAAIQTYAGETVKLRLSPQLQAVWIDDIGLMETTVPGWSLGSGSDALAPSQDAHGSYLTAAKPNGVTEVLSSRVDLGVIDTPSAVDGRSYVVTYAIGDATGSLIFVDWVADSGGSWRLYQDAADSPTGLRNGRFTVYDWLPTPGRFQVHVSGGGKLYSLGDNVARQQLAEPFSQQISLPGGAAIDTSTGSFGTSATDLAIQGGSTPLVLTRYYAGHSDRCGELGCRWTTSFDSFAAVYTNGDVAVVFGSGREEYFAWNGSSSTFAPVDPRVTSSLIKLGSGDYQYATKTKTLWNFTGAGDLVSVVDPNGNALTLYRDPVTDLVSSVADDAGRAVSFTYDGTGLLTEATTPDGATVAYGYDGNGDLVSVERAIAPGDPPARTEYVYSRHRLTQIKERQGDATSNSMVTVLTATLDDVNRVIAETDAAGHALTIAYQTPANGVTRVTDALGHVTDYYFDHHARTQAVVAPTGDVAQWLYDAQGNLQSMIDPASNSYAFSYNTAGEPTGITDPLSQTTQISWDAVKHLPTQLVDGRGVYTVNTYDANGNLLQTVVDAATDALGNPVSGTHLDLMTVYTVDANGRTTSATVDPSADAFGNPRSGTHLDLMMTYAYDSAGNVTSKIVDPSLDAAGNPRAGSHLDQTWSWTYDADGHLLTASDPLNQTTTYEYDMLGRVKRVTNALSEQSDFVYNFSGQLILAQDGLGQQWTWTYDDRGLPLTKTDPDGKVWSYVYDDTGRMSALTDPLGHATVYAYDESARLIAETVDPDPVGGSGHLALTTSYAYDAAGNLASVTDPAGNVTAYGYDAAKRRTSVTLATGGVYTMAYDANGNLTTVTDPLSHATTYAYDAANRLVGVTNPLSDTTSFAYDAGGRRVSTTDPLSHVTSAIYDAAGRVTSVTDPLSRTTSYAYDLANNLRSVTDPLSHATTYDYDALNRIVTTTDPNLNATTVAYDAAGRRVSSTLPSGEVTTYAYNGRSLLTEQVVDAGTGRLNLTTSYAYDDAGRRVSMTNPRGYATTYAYDAANRQTSLTDALGGVVSFAYDAAGNVLSVTNPRGYASTSTYDGLGDLLSETDPLGRTQTWTYNLLGLPTSRTDARGEIVTYAYDDANQLTDLTDGVGAPLVSWTYDAAGRQASMTDPTGVTGWTYDAAGQVTQVASPQGTIGYGYDAAGRRASMTLPGSLTTSYGYDAGGRLTSLTDPGSRTTTYAYSVDDLVTAATLPNGVAATYEHDTADRLTAVEQSDGSGLLARWAYGLDFNGNRQQIVVTGSSVANGTESYGYDQLDRLTSATYVGGGSASWTYDPNGNRLTQVSGLQTTTYAYDQADQLTSISGPVSQTYGYDANGNRIAAGADLFAYDWDNRLTQATVGGTTVNYANTGDGLRASRSSGGATTDFLWDRESGLPQLVQETTGASATSYLHGPAGLLELLDGSGAAAFPLADGLGSIRLVTDGSGAVTGAADYDAWGNLQASSGASTSLGWDGELRDPATGQTYLRARDYSPGTGRFTSRDTVQPNAPGSQGWNPYAYAANNPVTVTDPSGQFISIAIQAMFAFAVGSFAAAGMGGGATASSAIAYEGAALGTDAALTGTAASALLGLGVAIAILLVATAVIVGAIWCYRHGAACGEAIGTVIGVGGVMAGLSWISFAFVGGAVATCKAGVNFTPFGFLDVVADCPKLPKAEMDNGKCLAKGAFEFGKGMATDAIFSLGNAGAVAEGVPGDFFAGVDAYISCAKGKKGGEENCRPSDGKLREKIRNPKSGKAAADDIPSWVKSAPNSTPYTNEPGSQFAMRMMDWKLGKGMWKVGATTEYNQIQKWADRAWMNPDGSPNDLSKIGC